MSSKPLILLPLIAGIACSVTIFVSAALLFLAEPVIGKMVLPLFGGAPAVWNTCMLFYQAVFLAGYLYAHLIGQRLTLVAQSVLHLLLLLGAACLLPFGISATSLSLGLPDAPPAVQLLRLLAVAVGFPLFVIAATAPLMQRWFSLSGHRRSCDPYFLYAASNLGSLLGLFCFPLLLEPLLSLDAIAESWQTGFVVLTVLLLLSTALLIQLRRSTQKQVVEAQVRAPLPDAASSNGISKGRLFYWMVLSFIPSSLMLGVTTYISTDVAAVPLLWIIPLAIYLFSFIVAFGIRLKEESLLRERTLSLLGMVLTVSFITESSHPAWLLIPLHLLLFWCAALVLHLQLAIDRPAPRHLTIFYLCLSIGGVLGGIFNGLVAPEIFTSITEYPLMIACACMLQAGWVRARADFIRWRVLFGSVSGLLLLALVLSWISQWLQIPAGRVNTLLVFLPPALLAYRLVNRPGIYGLLLLTMLVSSLTYRGVHGDIISAQRNFFGVLRVARNGDFITLVHGNTQHGKQNVSEQGCVPLSYYYSNGPAGNFFRIFNQQPLSEHARIAAVGLGTGALACYSRAGQSWTFFEINPAVTTVARDPSYFSFLSRSLAQPISVLEGDARLTLRAMPAGGFDLIVLDAFSSDSIPIHLLTREALELYLSRLSFDGVMLFHVSNRFLDLEGVLARLAEQAGLAVYSWRNLEIQEDDAVKGKDPSHWMILGRSEGNLAAFVQAREGEWQIVKTDSRVPLWTDQFSNLLTTIRTVRGNE